jgi:rhamnose utilization protein RhaD (predicted bifunctional aldolase and dehydrogenase)
VYVELADIAHGKMTPGVMKMKKAYDKKIRAIARAARWQARDKNAAKHPRKRRRKDKD